MAEFKANVRLYLPGRVDTAARLTVKFCHGQGAQFNVEAVNQTTWLSFELGPGQARDLVRTIIAFAQGRGQPDLPVTDGGAAGPHDPPFPFRATYRRSRPGELADKDELDVVNLAARWHHLVTRITVLNDARFRAIHARLLDGYKFDEIERAITAYGKDAWHRRNKAWKDLADFFTPKMLDTWIAKTAPPENPPPRAPLPDNAAGDLAQRLADVRRARTDRTEAVQRFMTLPIGTQQQMLEQACRELHTLRPKLRLTASLTDKNVYHQVALIMLRRETPKGVNCQLAIGNSRC